MSKVKCFMVERGEEQGTWINVETGEIYPKGKAKPPGAMWNAH